MDGNKKQYASADYTRSKFSSEEGDGLGKRLMDEIYSAVYTEQKKQLPVPSDASLKHHEAEARASGSRSSNIEDEGFMFIPLTGQKGEKHTRDATKSMRAHVMRTYRRRRAARDSPGTAGLTSEINNHRSCDHGDLDNNTMSLPGPGQRYRFKLGKSGLQTLTLSRYHQQHSQNKQTLKRSAIRLPDGLDEEASPRQGKSMWTVAHRVSPTHIGDGQFDPFDVLPFRLSHWDQRLIYLWRNYDRNPWCPINGRSPWFVFALRNELLLHANLYTWAMHFASKLSEDTNISFLRENPRALEHKGHAVQLINQQLSDPDAVHNDELLAAVAIILNVEITESSREEAAIHMNGLYTMINLRGGISSLNRSDIQQLIMRLISWNDLFFGELFGGPLRFRNLPQWEEALSSMQRSPMEGIVATLEPLEPRFAGQLQREVLFLHGETRNVARQMQITPFTVLGEQEKVERHQNIHRLVSRLCLSTKIAIYPEIDGETSLSWRAVAVANMIYIHHHLHGFPTHMPVAAYLVRQLRHLMFSAHQFWQISHSLHIWVLSVGAVVSNLHSWFVQCLASVCVSYDCRTWLSLSRSLKLHPWVGHEDELKFSQVWDAVEPILNIGTKITG